LFAKGLHASELAVYNRVLRYELLFKQDSEESDVLREQRCQAKKDPSVESDLTGSGKQNTISLLC
jgi:hypothetical protein